MIMNSVNEVAQYLLRKYAVKDPEAPKNAPFGEFAWPKHREGKFPEEEDTQLEKEVYQDIKKHFSSQHIGLPKLTVRILMKILENEYYSKVLHPPVHKTLYRGLKITNVKDLVKLIGLKELDINNKGSIEFNDSVKSENGYSSSWTFQKQISKDFSGNYGKAKQGYMVTLIADVSDNKNRFLAGPGGLYDVEGLSKWHLEKETVGLEPITIKKIEWEKL